MISNRRRLLSVAVAAVVLSTQVARATETVIGTILEEVSREQLQRFADEYRRDWKRDPDGTYEYRGRRYDEKEWDAYWRKRYREERRNERKDRKDRDDRRDRDRDRDRNDWNDDEVRRRDAERARREREAEARRRREDERRRRADEERVRRMDEEVRRRDEEIRCRDALQRLMDAAQR